MSKNVYKSAQGVFIDIDGLRLVNETAIAVGNMKVNTRGDQIAPDGSIIKTRNELMKEHYNLGSPVTKTEKSQFGAKTVKRSQGKLAASVESEAKKEPTDTQAEPPVAQPTVLEDTPSTTLRGSLAQSVATTNNTVALTEDLQTDFVLSNPKSTLKRI